MIRNAIVFGCDDCKKELNTDKSNFNEAKQIAHSEGWIYVHPKKNYCDDCRFKYNPDNLR